jgi:hypothetical protein
MKIIAIIFSVSIVLCQSEDLVDDRLSWLLTNPDNIDKLDEDKSKNIKIELKKILEKFNNEVKEKNIFTPTSVKETVSTKSKFDEDEYYRLRKEGMDKMFAKMYATTHTKYTKDAIKRKGFDLNTRLSSQIPEWSDIVEYYGGYSELTDAGIKKEDLWRFHVNKELKRVEIADDKRCVAIIEEKGMKDYGLKYYNIEQTQKIIYGIYQLDDFTITDLYYISKSNRYHSPKIKFTFTDQELVQSKQDVFIKSVFDINNKIVELSKPYLSTIEMMINDLVPLRYYNTFSHRKELIQKQIENQRQLERKEEIEKETEKRLHFTHFVLKRDKAIAKMKEPLFDFMEFKKFYGRENRRIKRHSTQIVYFFQQRTLLKKKSRLIKKYERRERRKAVIGTKYTDDFLEYYYNSSIRTDVKRKIIATKEKVNKIGATTDCQDLRYITNEYRLDIYPEGCSYKYDIHGIAEEWLPGINEEDLNRVYMRDRFHKPCVICFYLWPVFLLILL